MSLCDPVKPGLPALVGALRRGDRRALARALTLVESTRSDHRAEAEQLLAAVLPATGTAVRIGVTGPPGAGKSTLIERFGLAGIARGHRVAVLADKTRMSELGRSSAAFIRPSSAGDAHGGAARRSREAVLLCEAAGFDAVIVESVGVGQAETAVADITDMLLLVLPPAAGDELQAIKRGIVELVDLVLVNKADGQLVDGAQRTAADYANAMRLIRPRSEAWTVTVRAVSALEGWGIDEIWDDVARFRAAQTASGAWERRRREQARTALWAEIEGGLVEKFRAAPEVAARLAALEAGVVGGTCTPGAAARELLAAFFKGR